MKTKTTSDAVGAIALLICGLPVMVGVLAVWRGVVLTFLWSWFVVGYFHVPPLSVPLAIGFCLIAGFFSSRVKREESFGEALGWALLGPAFTLLIGWVVTKFI